MDIAQRMISKNPKDIHCRIVRNMLGEKHLAHEAKESVEYEEAEHL